MNSNCSNLLDMRSLQEQVKKAFLKFEAEGRQFALEQFIQTVKGQNNFW